MVTTKALFAAEGLDDRSLEFLTSAIEKNNLPGFDYYEFKRAVAALLQMNMDEATAYKSAFTTAATVGLTKEKLAETAAYYRNIIVKEKEHFDQALQSQNAAKVTARQQEMARLQDQIARHKAEIARLQDEVGGYLQQIQAGEEAIGKETERLNTAKANFERAHQSVTLHIDRDIENIHKYLG